MALDVAQSELNSTTLLLGVSGNYTGAFEDVSSYSEVSVSVFADVDGATNGLRFQWSDDGVALRYEDPYTYTAGSSAQGRTFRSDIRQPFFRIYYTNGTGAQSAFYLRAFYREISIYNGEIWPSVKTITNRSGTITTGGVSEIVAATNANRRGLFFQNVSNTVMWLRFGAVANVGTPSYQINAHGGYLSLNGPVVTPQQLNVICATAGKAWSAFEF